MIYNAPEVKVLAALANVAATSAEETTTEEVFAAPSIEQFCI